MSKSASSSSSSSIAFSRYRLLSSNFSTALVNLRSSISSSSTESCSRISFEDEEKCFGGIQEKVKKKKRRFLSLSLFADNCKTPGKQNVFSLSLSSKRNEIWTRKKHR